METKIHSQVWQSYEIQQLLALIKPQGIDTALILQGTGVTEGMLENPSLRVSLDQELALYIALAEHNQDPLLALKHGQRMGLNYFGVLGTLMLSSETLAQALHYLQQFFPLVSWASYIGLKKNDKTATVALSMVPTPAGEKTGQFEVVSTFMSLMVLMQQITMSDFKFSQVSLAYPIDKTLKAQYETYFQCQVIFAAKQNSVLFSQREYLQKMPAADVSVIEALVGLCQRSFETLKNNRGLVGAVRQQLENADEYYLSLEQLANIFNQSSRTLRRKLDEAGTSYQQILESVRFDNAVQLLQNTELTIENIAYQLGYSDSRSFRNAFKRWADVPPGEYRTANRKY